MAAFDVIVELFSNQTIIEVLNVMLIKKGLLQAAQQLKVETFLPNDIAASLMASDNVRYG